ncbi:alpha-E domain-containing protein [Sphingomonas piscis]|uniref:Alpha-E domain-containing protein n=2 Tax=Sphingomonas piscis TaxID=2714943 RepID=A0A6G7YTL6_9SPHN|nr:alpha-E domain-containing protein [Sphingomonas piscis]QIK80085.1 alpha-E domain-containing protein [Sphingomonas piscis]
MLSRTASNLYWIGRAMERAEFTTRLIEATIRLGSLAGNDEQAWQSALAVVGGQLIDAADERTNPAAARRFLLLDPTNPGSVFSCLDLSRENARASRNLLTQEVWEALNRAWGLLRGRASVGGIQATLNLIEQVKAEARGFEGALARMLRSEAYWFLRLGSMIERGDNTARLLDVKYYLLLPEGQEVGGRLDRDQWTTLLQVVSGQGAYRQIYKQELKSALVADLLIFRSALPRSLTAASSEAVALLGQIGAQSGRQGEADRLARRRLDRLENNDVAQVIDYGMHEYLQRFIADTAALDQAIARQFRFA